MNHTLLPLDFLLYQSVSLSNELYAQVVFHRRFEWLVSVTGGHHAQWTPWSPRSQSLLVPSICRWIMCLPRDRGEFLRFDVFVLLRRWSNRLCGRWWRRVASPRLD